MSKSGKHKKKSKKENDEFPSHAYTINDFWKVLSEFSELHEDINKGTEKHKVFNSISDYMEIVKEVLKKSDLFKNITLDEVHVLIEDIENYVFKKIYKR
jgi:hypothetical protein